MKKILLSFLLVVFVFMAHAQDAKPTKEQTVNYIINSLKEYQVTKIINAGGDPNTTLYWDVKDISINDCVLLFKMSDVLKIPSAPRYGHITISDVKLNLKDIEEVEFSANDYSMGSVILRCSNEAKSISLKTNKDGVNTDEMVSSIAIPSPGKEKILQAFNYLRKLCGAPEPIKF
ncbi:MAG TPA: hypothetical protein VIL78_09855 [Hanamia sp.]